MSGPSKNKSTGSKEAEKTALLSIASNGLLAILKATAGIFGNSYALIADAIESTTDVFASFLVLLGLKYANRPADENHPYGHGKIEPLTTFIVVAFLLVSATIIAVESIDNIQTEHELPKSWTLYVLGAIIIWKELSYRFVLKQSKASNSTALLAEAWHHRSDAITSILAFVGISIALFMGDGYETADDWAALIASFFIIYNAYLIFRPALSEIMDEHVHEETVAQIRNEAQKVNGVLGTEKCFVRKAGMQYHVDLHVIVDGDISVRSGHDIAHKLEDRILHEMPNIGHIIIHIEPEEEFEHEGKRTYPN